MNRNIIFLSGLLLLSLFSAFGQFKKSMVHFKAEDGIDVTADHYFTKNKLPYVILLHQELSSRGEFDSVVERVIKIGYHCLAVDLRSGNKFGFVNNETSKSAHLKDQSIQIIDALRDVKAAIKYTRNLSDQPIILFGAGSSASLALIEAKNNEDIKSVIALSPGEYFRPDIDMKTYLSGFSKSVFVGCSDSEYPFIEDMFSGVENNNKTIFKPVKGPGARGTASLRYENPTRDEYWLSLILFFRTIR
jgi:hypothetical protein